MTLVYYLLDLPVQSVDAVVAANSFHWFDFHRSLDQIHGILKPNGTFAVCWLFPSPETDWVKAVADYLAPMYEHNSITWPMWYYEKILNQIASTTKFSKQSSQSEMLPPNFVQQLDLSPRQAYELFTSFSVIVGSSNQTKMEFKEFFENQVGRHCSITGEKKLTLTHVCPMAWFKKIN